MDRRTFLKKMGGAVTMVVLFGSVGVQKLQAAVQQTSQLNSSQAVKDRIPIKIDPKIYDAYVGQYEFGPGKILTVTKEKNRLMRQGSGGVKVELFPASETQFFRRDVDMLTTFVKDKLGRVIYLTHTHNGQVRRAKKIR